MQNTMKPGTPVTNIETLRDGPRVIPPGTLGIVEWCDRARGEACVQFIGHIVQREVPLAALRKVARLHVGVRNAHAPAQR